MAGDSTGRVDICRRHRTFSELKSHKPNSPFEGQVDSGWLTLEQKDDKVIIHGLLTTKRPPIRQR